MKKLFSLFVVAALVVSTGIVGCGGAVDNSTKKTDTAGQKAPPVEDDDTQGNEDGKRKTSTAGGQAKTETAPM